jgi:hypothetical protein
VPSIDRFYILDADGEPQPCDVLTWGAWFETHDKHVADDVVGETRISTVFFGVDLRLVGGIDHGQPVLWETMIFGGPCHLHHYRFTSERAALAKHTALVAQLRAEKGVVS